MKKIKSAKKRMARAQSSISLWNSSKKKIIKGLGLLFFLVGAVLIITSFLEIPLTGNVVSERLMSTSSLAGIFLEIIGVVLMVIKIEE